MDKNISNFELQSLLDQGKIYINQFVTFNDLDGENKLQNIKSSKLYAGFSWGFNDVFDSQLRLSFLDKQNLFKTIKDRYSLNDFANNPKVNDVYLDNIYTLLHIINISCFTELNPLSLESNNMWGLYSKSGTGICVQYKIEDIRNFFAFNCLQPCIFKKIQYDGSIDRPRIFENLVTAAINIKLKLGTSEEINQSLQLFHCSKTIGSMTEKEWRFISPQNILPYFNEDLSEKCIFPPYEAFRDGHASNKFKIKFEFIKPARIVFGWNCDYNKNDNYKRLMDYCKKDNIEFIILNKYIDYNNNQFRY